MIDRIIDWMNEPIYGERTPKVAPRPTRFAALGLLLVCVGLGGLTLLAIINTVP